MVIKSNYNDLNLQNERDGDLFLAYFKIILIPLAVYICVLLGFFGVLKFQVGLKSVVMISLMLVVAMFFARHSAEFAYSKLSAKSDDFKNKLKEFIVSNLIEISSIKKSNANYDNFFENYTRNYRSDHLASIGVGIFPALGILGTFISIAISMPSFASTNAAGLEKEMSMLLNGIGVAFYTSIYGVFLALWWMFFEKLGLTKIERFAIEQKELSRQFFWQKDELEQQFMSDASKHFDDIRSVFSRISNEAFFKNLDSVVGNKFKTYTELQTLEQRMIGEAQIKIDQNIRLLNKAGAKQDEFVKVHTEILRATVDLSSSLKEMQKSFATEYNRLNTLMQDRVGGFEKSINRFENNLNSLDVSLKNFAIKVMQEQSNAMDAFRASLIEGIGAFKAVYEQESVPSENELERESLLSDLKKSANELNDEVERVMKNIESTSDTDEAIQ